MNSAHAKSLYEDSLVFSNIQKYIVLTCEEKEFLKSVLYEIEVPPKHMLLRQGQICRQLYFVSEGSIRAYNLDTDGKESTIMFGIEDWWITDMYAFTQQKSALLSLETLEDTRVVVLEFEVFDKALQHIPKLERFFRILFQNAYVREQLRALDSISLTTEERYRKFLDKYPQIVEKVTQKQIASYLGVTPEFLSSVKKK